MASNLRRLIEMPKKKENALHFSNGLLREIRSKAAAADDAFVQKAIRTAKSAAKKSSRKSVFSRVAPATAKRLLSQG